MTSTMAARKDFRVADLSMAPFGRKEMILADPPRVVLDLDH